MKSDEYEQLVSEIADEICKSAPEYNSLLRGSGHKNRIAGLSGYSHQIDVSLQGTERIFLIECKQWKNRVGVAEVLVIAGRASDIQAGFPEASIHAVLISMRGASRGALQLAQHFGINIEIATSVSDSGLRIGRFVHHAVSDGVGISDHCEAILMRKGVVIP